MLRFKDVSKTFYTARAATQALKNLNFTVNKGEFLSIIGPSGCGKTTILSLICGLIKPTTGEITFSEPNSAVAYMLQHDHLFEWRNILQNVTLGLEIKGLLNAKTLNETKELLSRYGLSEFTKHYPHQLSGGMRQRVALIRTIAMNPQILLLDEPFSALDFQTRLKVCDDVYSIIKKENKTAILVTHDISEAISLSDRILVLTNRPATLLNIHETHLENISTPLLRREAPGFSTQFQKLWQLLNTKEAENESN
ncbi:MAG: ABC transporter ATP-binding protein [Clostridia bacterium]